MFNLPEPAVKMKKLDSELTDPSSSDQSQALQSVDHHHHQPIARFLSNDHGKQQQQQPLTIFYNGKVCFSNVTDLQARTILYHARREMELESARSPQGSGPAPSSWQSYQAYSPNNTGSMKRSLQRFLQKRKNRTHSMSPYNP
ncbi:hypothetical protein SAY86_015474 [Trapa natans]|uniref:Protein TIFY n=1 Tax=Trapa natans TaxID=22666 RepID=A0AAN7LJS8_TRANT|nr:hypothetical protein SAY86_015474 [Trapa natans]